MRYFSTLFLTAMILTAGTAYTGELDNYYLEKFGEIPATSSEAVLKAAQAPIAEKCGMPLRKELRADWNKLESGTQKTLAKYLAKPTLTGTLADQRTYTSSGGHFVIHYTIAGADAPPLTTTPPHAVPDWVITVGDVFENVYNTEVTSFGYSVPAPAPYPVYLQQLVTSPTAAYFGVTDPDLFLGPQSASSYITVDNDFADANFSPYNGLAGLQITAAHEFHHAIQFFYNYYFEIWYGEATASWMEDEVYDSVNQLYEYSRSYLQSPSTSIDTPVDGGYSRWIFNRLLAENHGGRTTIRAVWDKLRGTTVTSSNINASGDILMLPVIDSTMKDMNSDLATEFLSFAKRLYAKDWTTHTNELSLLYSVPLPIESIYSIYPVNQASFPFPGATLPHYAIKYFKFAPSSAVANLTVTVNRTTGIQTALLRKTAAGVTEIPVDSSTSPTSYNYVVNGFGALAPGDEVVLVTANTTAVDNHMVSFNTDGSSTQVIEPPASRPAATSGGGGGGCFIATAAYGSYLHPKVVLLRNFRDNYLLTNPPGRLLVAAYYKLSPPLAAIISRHETLRFAARLLLTPLILAVEHAWLAVAAVTGLAGGALLLAGNRKRKQLIVRSC